MCLVERLGYGVQGTTGETLINSSGGGGSGASAMDYEYGGEGGDTAYFLGFVMMVNLALIFVVKEVIEIFFLEVVMVRLLVLSQKMGRVALLLLLRLILI